MIRRALTSDAEQIAQVHIQSWRETYQNIIDQSILDQLNLEEKIRIWQTVTTDPKQSIFVYEEQNKILGFVCYSFPKDTVTGELKAFYLLNQIRGQGIGRCMVEKGLALFKEKNYKFVKFTVLNQTPSRYFYEKLGAYCTGEEPATDLGKDIKDLYYQWDL